MNPYCTAEPKSLFYGSQSFTAANPLSSFGAGLPGSQGYFPANLPAASDLAPALEAGSHSDFCVGFTLTPNADPAIIRTASNTTGSRIQPATPYPDLAETRVADNAKQPVQGDDLDDVVVDLPTGYVGSLASVPTCSIGASAFGAGNWKPANCPATASSATRTCACTA